MKSRKPTVIPLFLFAMMGYTPATAQETDNPSEFVLRAKVRDFKEMNPTDTSGNHPHFNNENGCSAQKLGMNSVESEIDPMGPSDGGSFPGDGRTPALASQLGAMARCYDPPERFTEWFSDRGPDTNRSFLVELPFKRDDATGFYQFNNDAFFPIDSGKPYAKFRPDDPDPFGHLHPDTGGSVNLSAHNFGFTMELHTEFTYEEGTGQFVTFSGDDDIWVFLNGKRVIDLGGLHTTETGTADLDSLKDELGLENGNAYPLDFFFAERHTSSSKCFISTNLAFNTSLPLAVAPQPDRGRARLDPGSGAFDIAIFDRTGRLIRRIPAGLRAGTSGFWDGRDAYGRAAAPGTYFWRATAVASGGSAEAGLLTLRQ